jgi:hypothetical protein
LADFIHDPRGFARSRAAGNEFKHVGFPFHMRRDPRRGSYGLERALSKGADAVSSLPRGYDIINTAGVKVRFFAEKGPPLYKAGLFRVN